MASPSELKMDLAKSMIAPGSLQVIGANTLLSIIQSKCGFEVAKVYQQLVMQKITPEQIPQEVRESLIKFCAPRIDVLSKSLKNMLENIK